MVRNGRGRIVGVVVVALALVAGGCTSDSGGSKGGGATKVERRPHVMEQDVTLQAHGGTEQIWMLGDPDTEVELVNAAGEVVPTKLVDKKGALQDHATRTTDDHGALVLRYVPPGKGYVLARTDGKGRSEAVTVTSPKDHPAQSFYADQKIEEGYGYLTTRDGTQLAINVTLPGPPEDGPYPTVVEYSGYDPANPSPSLVTISKTLAGQLGFATVGVNIRGSGCSGGSMQLREEAQALDGYDVVETIAAQPWVQDHKVGMVGISYPAIAMLYVASTQPPSLSAIAPMAAYDDGFRALLWPGGIQNKGFARSWVNDRYKNAQNPSPEKWVQTRIADGDETCAKNLEMRGQNVDLASLIDAMPYFPTEMGLGESFAPESFVHKIQVPTYLVASWQDEQVGGHAPTMIPQFDHLDDAYFTLINGYHTEGLAEPSVLQSWLEFLQLFVARKVPDTSKLAGLYPVVDGEIIKDGAAAQKMPVPPEEFDSSMSYDQALAHYREIQARVRVLFDEGGAASVPPGVPTAAFEHDLKTYPSPDTQATTWYLGADGALAADAPTAADGDAKAIDRYTSDPSARPEVDLVQGEDSWERLPTYDWQQPPAGSALSYVSPPLADDTVMVGSGSADLWVRSSEADTDLQVTLSEVRPDGKETYVQSGWLRASKRKLDEKRSTVLQPLPTQLEADAAPLPAGKFTLLRVEIYPFGHAFRAGSRIRVTISAPGGDKPVWSFVTLKGTQDNEIARTEAMPSAIVLPVIPNLDIPTPLPACPSLRGQPCRPYVATPNE